MTAREGDIQFTPELGDDICALVVMPMTINKICALDGMPSKPTLFKWLRLYPEFANQYARAKQEQADVLAEEILDIADNPQEGTRNKSYKNAKGDDVNELVRGDMIEHRRLRVDARKFLAGKMKPKVYGDAYIMRGDPENPIVTKDTTATGDKAALQHFFKQYGERVKMTPEQIANGEDLV